ncbi:MAG: DUF4270 domain-containing protein [Flavobacteriaceae bacterium]|nr:DUF4270 domain-containing protein [Flavobacteriaceae bacterium]
MKYFNSVLFKSTCALALIFMNQSCENEFSEIGTDIVGTPGIEIKNKTYPVTTYNKKITPFQSNGLAENLLGYYYDDVFGATTVNFVGQLTPTSLAPDFGENTVLDSVVLTIPYNSTATSGETTTYELDSLYGTDPIKLSVFRNNYYLRAFDPNGELDDTQNYYSNGTLAQGETLGASELEGQLLYYSNSYLPSAKSIELWETNEETEVFEVASTIPPSLRIHLFGETSENASVPDRFWDDVIFSKEDDEVLNKANSFYEYFRGLYFKVEANSVGNKNLAQLNFSSTNSNVKLYYTYDLTTTVDGVENTTNVQGEYELLFSGNRVNIFNNDFNTSILQTIEDTSTDTEGDDYLYLKGGEGSMAIIELFSEDENGTSGTAQLNEFREINDGVITTKRLINEAYLEFYVETTLSNLDKPRRVYVYDVENNLPVADFFLDQTSEDASSDSKFTHLVPLTKETGADGVEEQKYKIRLTEHLNNIVMRDSTNVKLGLVVSSNAGAANTRDLLNPTDVEGVPIGTVLSPKSIVLHGNNSPDAAKRVKFNVYYTEPNN